MKILATSFLAVAALVLGRKSILESSSAGRHSSRYLQQGSNSCFSAVINLACGGSVSGFTTSATNDGPAEACSLSNEENNVWHKMVGTGDIITLSTDNPLTSYDTRLYVFEGASCNDLTCIAADDNSGSSVSSNLDFKSTVGTEYFILVGGGANLFSAPSGQYELSAACQLASLNDECTGAVMDLECGGTISGSTKSASHDGPVRACSNISPIVNQGNNVWHRMVGTGDIITLSTDNHGTDFDTQL